MIWVLPYRVGEVCETVVDGRYMYMDDLAKLSARVAPTPAPAQLGGIHTPLRVQAWEHHLSQHPDKNFVEYLLLGIRRGIRIGYDYAHHACKSAKQNMLSARQNPPVVRQYIAEECKLIGPLSGDVGSPHTNRLGVIPKPHQLGKWRLIVDLSHPDGSSVNDGIEPELCSLTYQSVDDAQRVIVAWERAPYSRSLIWQAHTGLSRYIPTTECSWAWCGTAICM